MYVHFEIVKEVSSSLALLTVVLYPFCEYIDLRKEEGKISNITNLPHSSKKKIVWKTEKVVLPSFLERLVGISFEAKIIHSERVLYKKARKLLKKETAPYFLLKEVSVKN